MNIHAQIVGILGLIAMIVGMQSNKKKKMLQAQIITNICFIIQYFILGSLTGSIMYIVNTIRSSTFYFWDKNKEPNIFILLVFIVLAISFGIPTYQGIYSLFPIIESLISTYGAWQKKAKVMRIAMMISTAILIIHDVHFGAYSGILTHLFVFLSSLIGFLRHEKLIFVISLNRRR